MCLCDDKYFKVTNTKTGEVKFYKRAASIARRFELDKDLVFKCIGSKYPLLRLDGEGCRVEVNSHPECQRIRRKIKKHLGLNPSYLTGKQITEFKHLIEKRELGL